MTDLLGNQAGLRDGRVRHDHGELLAPVTRREVGAADGFPENLRDPLEHFIADRVTVVIVDLLEKIEVDDRQRKRTPVPRRLVECAPQLVLEVAVVVKIRQPIGNR